MYNNCTFAGNLGKDPEAKQSKQGGTFTVFSLAVNKPGAKDDEKPLWLSVTCFGKTAEFASKYLKQGSLVLVNGELEVENYTTKEGKPGTAVKLLANRVVSLRKNETGAQTTATAGKTAAAAPAGSTDEDIPF